MIWIAIINMDMRGTRGLERVDEGGVLIPDMDNIAREGRSEIISRYG